MKRIFKTTIIVSLFLIAAASFTTTTHVAIAQEDHEGHDDGNECDNPSQQMMIDTHSTDVAFDKTELKVDKGACVMFMFKNTQLIEHDFTILRTNGSEWTHLHLANSGDNETGPAPGLRVIHLQMPDEDVTFKFVCTVTGHEALGMRGNLLVGEGSPSDDDGLPGFGLI